jgi:hypothetical protein
MNRQTPKQKRTVRSFWMLDAAHSIYQRPALRDVRGRRDHVAVAFNERSQGLPAVYLDEYERHILVAQETPEDDRP